MPADVLLKATRQFFSERQESVIAQWLADCDWSFGPRRQTPVGIPVIRHLEAAVSNSGPGERALAATLLQNAEKLLWGRSYTAEDFGEYFFNNYGYMELVGTRGHFVSDSLVIGFILFGPEVEYPQHWHDAEELYIPLTGGAKWSRNSDEYVIRQSGEVIIHESNMPHAMTTLSNPLLALYIWRAPPDSNADLAQKSRY